MTRRVVISGMGTVNPLSTDVASLWRALLAGHSGIAPSCKWILRSFASTSAAKSKIGIRGLLRFQSRQTIGPLRQFAIVAALEAVKESGFDVAKEDPFRCGASSAPASAGSTNSKINTTTSATAGRAKSARSSFQNDGQFGPGKCLNSFRLDGPCTAVATACASAANAIADALRCIQRDEADVMITGGCESTVTNMGLGGFCAARALSQRNDNPPLASRPFDRDRTASSSRKGRAC